MTAFETFLRMHLADHFGGAMFLDRVLPGGESCLVEHEDGTRGVVATEAILSLGVKVAEA